MLNTKIYTQLCCISILTGILFSICWPALSSAAGPARVKMATTVSEKITITMGKSLIVESPEPVKRVAIAQPTIAEAMVLSPRQIYINAKVPGLTNLTLWGTGDTVKGVLDVEVVPDMNRLKETIHTMLPGEKGVLVNSSHDYLTLSGSISSADTASRVMELARAYAPVDKDGKPKLINLLEIGGVHQVMLDVRVSEMSRSLARRLGINFSGIGTSGHPFGLSLLNNLTGTGAINNGLTSNINSELAQSALGWPETALGVTDNINGVLNFLSLGTTWTVFIDALKENGLLKVLAEPTLITLSGKEARFLAGGEFPIPVPQGSGGGTVVTIEYKPFGVGLAFTPVVLSNGKISMQVAPEVSDLDFTTGVALQGFIIPSITTRRVATTVELADGQSFAIAGLLKEDTREVVKKFPVLGDIPVLGTLFRSSSYQKRDTELIVIVTPHLVKPLDMKKQTLPTDQFVEPDDFEFYLLGALEGKGEPRLSSPASPPAETPRGKIEGKFGHITPQQ